MVEKPDRICRLALALIGLAVLAGCLPYAAVSPISLKRESTIGKGIYRLNGIHDTATLIWSPNAGMLAGLVTRSPHPLPDCPPHPIFCIFEKETPSEIFIVDLETLQRRTIFREQDVYPIISRIFWFPDGQHIGYLVYGKEGAEEETWSIDLQGRNEVRLSEGNRFPHWSPDGSKIAQIPEGEIIVGHYPSVEVVDASTGESRTVFRSKDKEGSIQDLAWSWDQKHLVFSYHAYGNETPAFQEGIYLLNIADGQVLRIGEDMGENFGYPAFSPVDNLLALQRSRPRFSSHTTLIRDLARKCEISLPIESTVSASWSSDGQLMLVRTWDRAYIVNLVQLLGSSFETNDSICP